MTLYLLLPVTLLLFAWKAALFPLWGSVLLCIATGVVVSHVMMPFSRFSSWRLKALLSLSAAIIAGGVMLGFGRLQRPFDLYRANLSGQWLRGADLRNADVRDANLIGADLSGANLSAVRSLTQTQLDEACGNASTKLPEGLTLKPCSTDR
jgi:hypothetical protein